MKKSLLFALLFCAGILSAQTKNAPKPADDAAKLRDALAAAQKIEANETFEKDVRKAFSFTEKNPALRKDVYNALLNRYASKKDKDAYSRIVMECLKDPAVTEEAKRSVLWNEFYRAYGLDYYTLLPDMMKELLAFKDKKAIPGTVSRGLVYMARSNVPELHKAGIAAVEQTLPYAADSGTKCSLYVSEVELLWKQGQYEKARAVLTEAQKLPDLKPGMRIDLVLMMAESRPADFTTLEETLKIASGALQIAGKDSSLRCRVYDRMMNRCGAYAIRDGKRRTEICRDAAKDPLLNADSRAGYQMSYLASLPRKEHMAALKELLKNPELSTRVRASIYEKLASLAQESPYYMTEPSAEQRREALTYLTEIPKLDKVEPWRVSNANSSIAQNYLELGETEKAREYAEKSGNLLVQARLARQQKDYAKAMELYEKGALKQRSVWVKFAYEDAARCAMALKDYEKVLYYLEKVKKSGGAAYKNQNMLNTWTAHVKKLMEEQKKAQ